MQPPTPVAAQRRWLGWLLAVLLVLVTMALYWPVTSYGFFDADDNNFVAANPVVQKGLTWESIKWACLNPVVCNWHPVTMWSHMLVCQVFGLKPWGHHLTNVLLHAANTGLVFLLFRLLTGALWRSVLVAALFAWHPLHVESVVWVAERKDVLSGCFGLLTLIAYACCGQDQSLKSKVQSPESDVSSPWSVVRGPWSLHLLPLFFFALGLMSKPMLVTWPFVMLLLDYWPLRRLGPSTFNFRPRRSEAMAGQLSTLLRLVREKIPFFVLAALMSVVTFVVQQRGGSLAMGESLSLGGRSGNALISYCRHLGKLFWPTDMAVYYPHPGHWPMGKLVLAGGLVLGASVVVWVQRRRYPYLLVGWLWFVGMLVPVIGLVQTGGQAMADRHTYLPSLGLLLLAIWGANELTRRWRYQVLACSVAGGAVTILCLALTRQQIGYWKDSEVLFRHAVEVTKDNYVAHNMLGYELGKKGQSDEAMRQIQEAIRLQPNYAEAHNNLGSFLGQKGQTDEAIQQFQEALRLKPDGVEAQRNLGVALEKKGQEDQATSQYQQALRLKPDDAEAHNNFGVALYKKGQTEEAIRHYQEAIRLQPDYAKAHNNLGFALSKQGQTEEAIRHYQEAIRLQPDYAEAHNNLGVAFYQQRRSDEAIRQFQEALRLKPEFTEARKNLEAVLATKAHSSQQPGASTNR
jgi:tetratricopeptide (TPR) repeat protein